MSKKKMLKVEIVCFAANMQGLAEAAEHAAGQLAMGTKSENITYSDKSHADYTVKECDFEHFVEQTNWSDDDEKT